jgi:hypothetical protein
LASGIPNLISRKNAQKAQVRRIPSLIGWRSQIAKAAEGWEVG